MKRIRVIVAAGIILINACNQKSETTSTTPKDTVAAAKPSCPACGKGGSVCRMPSRSLSLLNAKDSVKNGDSSTAEMVTIPGGTYQMGSNDFEDSKPIHGVTVKSFLMDEHEVTNAQFEKFVNATHYITIAERALNPKDYPGVDPDKLIPGSAVFTPPAHKVSLEDPYVWWIYVNGANWKHPKGPSSSIKGKDNEPVVQVAYPDAAAYAKWAGKRLPTEAEWEFAARANRQGGKFYWGNDLKPKGKWVANIYQGSFPDHNTVEDGYAGVAPVKSFPPNPFGLYDMDGNVWEWCNDLYRPDYYAKSPQYNPQGPKDSYDPEEPNTVKHVQRGGSFICSDEYCIRYKAGSRGKGETSSAGNNLGFRCVKDISK